MTTLAYFAMLAALAAAGTGARFLVAILCHDTTTTTPESSPK
jgi:hypothetical protein